MEVRKVSIIVPVFNEEKTVSEVLKRLGEVQIRGWKKEIIVVDDGSTDGSVARIKYYVSRDCSFLSHETNLGKGAAVRTGLRVASGDAVLIQDADLEYNPKEITKLLYKYSSNTPIYGSRNINPKQRGYWHYVLGVWLLTILTNLLYGSMLTDIYTCYKVVSLKLLRSLKLSSQGFEIEAEITVKLLKRGVKITEVPIPYTPRKFGEGKKISWVDGVKGLWVILKNYK